MEELLLSLVQLAIAILLSAIGAFLAVYRMQWFIGVSLMVSQSIEQILRRVSSFIW